MTNSALYFAIKKQLTMELVYRLFGNEGSLTSVRMEKWARQRDEEIINTEKSYTHIR